MIMNIEKVAAEHNRLGLRAPAIYNWMLENRPDLVERTTNGVGSETSWTYHLTPDTVWLLNINPSSHIHDDMYTFPLFFASVADGLAWKRLADHWFDLNVREQIKDCGGIFEPLRLSRLENLYEPALGAAGSKAFWANKPLPPDYEFFYRERPPCDPKLMELYREIENICPASVRCLGF